jgi:transposase
MEVMCTPDELLRLLLPNSTELALTTLDLDPDRHQIIVSARSVRAEGLCPHCNVPSAHPHSRYQRTLADLPWADFTVRIHLTVSKWFCSTEACPRRIFTERLPTLVAPWARRTQRLADRQRMIGLTVAGTAGARVATEVDQPTSRHTILRLVRQTPEREMPPPRHLGVDDWAQRKGRTYATILVDLDQGRPIDLLPDRTADTLASWLREHPGVEIITRDRAGAYAEGASEGAAEAVQVADRWHVLKNLGDALSRVFSEHPQALQPMKSSIEPEVGTEEGGPALSPESNGVPPALQSKVERMRQQRQEHRQARYDQVHALLEQGVSLRTITRELHLSRETVRNYARAAAAPAPQPRAKRASLLDPYKAYLIERWNAGCHVGTELLREIKKQGYKGSRSIALDFIAAIRRQQGVAPMKRSGLPAQAASDPTVRPMSPRELVWLVLQRPERLDEGEKARLLHARQATVAVEASVSLAQEFAVMVRERQHEKLEHWLERAEASGQTALRSFAGGIRRASDAVEAALRLPYSNGPVEGQVNRLKFLKRQMYGRAKFDLLRKRVLYAA